MEDQKPKKIVKLIKYIPLLAILILVFLVLTTGKEMTVEELLVYTPKNKLLAAIVLWGMYALKSLSVFFPLLLLYMAGGILFPLPVALCVNTIGIGISLTLPYLLGRYYGRQMVDSLVKKYPKLTQIQEFRQQHDLFFAFYVRIIGILPCDVVSTYMGAIRISYPYYLIGCILGLFPTICVSTIMGAAVSDPTSPAFLVALLIRGGLILISSLIFYIGEKRKKGDTS